jgi:ATP-binding cassette, subfamily B, bacterial
LAPRDVTTPAPAPKGQDGDEKRSKSLRPLKMLQPYILRHPRMLALAGTALVVSAIAMLAVPMAVRRMIDFGFADRIGGFINQYFIMLILIGLIISCASSARFFLVNWLGERVVADVRADVFRHLSNLGPAFYDRTHSGEIMSRLTADTTLIKSASGSTISQAIRNVIMLVGALIMMFITSWGLSLLVLVAIPLIVAPFLITGRMVRRLSRRAQDTLAQSSAYAAENLAAVRTMQAFTHEKAVSDRYAKAVALSFDAVVERLKSRALLTGLTFFLVVTSIVGVLWVGATQVVAGDMTGGRLLQFVLYALFAGAAVAELAEVWGEVSQAAGATERLAELLSAVPQIQSPANPVALPVPARGEISFDNVTFAYPSRPETSALNGISFTVKPGETVALVGPSGAGKSTVLNLILRFYDPQSGHVRLDGVKLPEGGLEAVRGRMALVPQEIALFADTVEENIRYGHADASAADVRAAAEAAQADGFIKALPDGYATMLGERGVTLSGGQRQRIAIARAILRNAPVLLLDEATSALDAESEGLVQKALERVMRNRTTVVIAHRLATIQRANRILVLEDGRIVEEGTHQQLLRAGGVYARLAELQFSLEAAQ